MKTKCIRKSPGFCHTKSVFGFVLQFPLHFLSSPLALREDPLLSRKWTLGLPWHSCPCFLLGCLTGFPPKNFHRLTPQLIKILEFLLALSDSQFSCSIFSNLRIGRFLFSGLAPRDNVDLMTPYFHNCHLMHFVMWNCGPNP